jgi:hypothetical protein
LLTLLPPAESGALLEGLRFFVGLGVVVLLQRGVGVVRPTLLEETEAGVTGDVLVLRVCLGVEDRDLEPDLCFAALLLL